MSIFDDMNLIKTQFDGVLEKLCNHAEENAGINIIIDDEDPQNPVFVEIENDAGESVRIGEDLRTDEGYRKLRISTSDIINHNKI